MSRHGCFILGWVLLVASVAESQEKSALPTGAVAQLGAHRWRLPGSVMDSAFSPDQATLVVLFREQSTGKRLAALFDVATGLERRQLDLVSADRIAIARHKPLMATYGNQGFELWDLKTERRLRRWFHPPKTFNATALAMSPDGTQIVAGAREGDKAVGLRFEALTWSALPSLYPTSASGITAVQFSSDGRTLVIVNSPTPEDIKKNPQIAAGAVSTWNAKTGKKLGEIDNAHYHVVIAPNGSQIARHVDEKTIEVVTTNPARRKIIRIAAPHTRFIFTADSTQLAILTVDQPIRMWDIATNREVRTFQGKVSPIPEQPRISDNGILAVAENNRRYDGACHLKLWNVVSGKQHLAPTQLPDTINWLAYSPNGERLAMISSDMNLLYDAKTGEELCRWVGHKGGIEQVAFAPDGKLLASASVDGTIGL